MYNLIKETCIGRRWELALLADYDLVLIRETTGGNNIEYELIRLDLCK